MPPPHSDPPPSVPKNLDMLHAQVSAMITRVELAVRAADQAKRAREPLTRGERLVALFLGAAFGSAFAVTVASTLVALGVLFGRR